MELLPLEASTENAATNTPVLVFPKAHIFPSLDGHLGNSWDLNQHLYVHCVYCRHQINSVYHIKPENKLKKSLHVSV